MQSPLRLFFFYKRTASQNPDLKNLNMKNTFNLWNTVEVLPVYRIFTFKSFCSKSGQNSTAQHGSTHKSGSHLPEQLRCLNRCHQWCMADLMTPFVVLACSLGLLGKGYCLCKREIAVVGCDTKCIHMPDLSPQCDELEGNWYWLAAAAGPGLGAA